MKLTIWTSDNSDMERMYMVTPTVTAGPVIEPQVNLVLTFALLLLFLG